MHHEGHIPKEIINFFSEGGGRSLILKGAPGTGKTTFALELLNHFRNDAAVCFVSSRIDEHALKRHVSWIDFDLLLAKGHDEGFRSMNGSSINRKELNRMESRVEEGDEFLEEDMDGEIGSGSTDGNTWTFDITSILPEIDMLYETLEAAEKDISLVAIDSIDSLGEKYGISPKRLLKMLQKDLVERSGVNVIFILETSGLNQLEYIGDGVISLEMNEMKNRRIRNMKVDKLRGQKIMMPSVPFTLKDGHFNSFDYDIEELAGSPNSLKKLELGSILENIIKPGKYVLFEFDRNVPAEMVQTLVGSIVEHNLKNSMRMYSTPSVRLFGNSPASYVSESQDKFKMISPISMVQRRHDSESMIKVDGDDFYTDFNTSFIDKMFDEKDNISFLLDANQIISHYGEGAVKDIELHISGLLQNGGSCIGFSWPSSMSRNIDMGISSNRIQVTTINSQWMMFGEKPYTPLYVLSPKKDDIDILELKIIL